MRIVYIIALLLVICQAHAQNSVVGYEYWFNEMHTQRQYVPISSASSSLDSSALSFTVDTASLGAGLHEVRIRVKDNRGHWSSVESRKFRIPPVLPANEIVLLRYWSDQMNNPPADLVEIPYSGTGSALDTTLLDFCNIDSFGLTDVFFQVKDKRGHWSAVISEEIFITSSGPVANAGVISGNASVCEGVTTTYSITGSQGASSFQWTLPNGWNNGNTVITTTDTFINVLTGSSGGQIQLSATNSCSSGSLAATPLNVSISGSSVTPGAIIGDTLLCGGTSATYSISPVAGASSYIWTLPSGWSGSSTGTSITVNAGANSGLVQVSAVTACGSSAASTLSVTIGGFSTSTISESICQNEVYLFNGDTLRVQGTYTDTFSGSTCDSIVTLNLTVDSVGVEVLALSGDTLVYQGTITGSIEWYLDGVLLSGINTPSYLPLQNGDYSVRVSNANGCFSLTSPVFNYTQVNVEEIYLMHEYRVYPNPNEGRFTISLDYMPIANQDIVITDLLGQILYSKPITTKDTYVDLDVSSGIYFVIVQQNSIIKSMKKLVIE